MARTISILLLCMASGCSLTKQQSAWELMQEQKEQAMIQQQKEDDASRPPTPTQAQVALSIIKQSQTQGRYFASLAYIDAYIKQFGTTPEVDSLRADALRMTGQQEQAVQAYRSLTTGKQSAQGWRGLGLIAGTQGNYTLAAQDLGKAAQIDPTNAAVLSDLGFARLSAGDIAGARLPLGQAAELDPTNTKVLANLALLLILDGDASGAGKVMERAQLEPESRNRVYQLAQQIQTSASARTAPSVAAASASSGSVVRNMNHPGSAADMAPAGAPTSNASAAAVRSSAAMPALLEPVMDRFGSQAQAQ